MMLPHFFTPETESTNELITRKMQQEELAEGFMVHTDFQSAGKGQVGNYWESEKGKNLLFSLVIYPHHIFIAEQFIISEIASLAVVKVLEQYHKHFTIKWPNDIYWKDKKIAGMLIENSLTRDRINYSIVGIGVNVNQEKFTSDAPNPISLKQIVGKSIDRKALLADIHRGFLSLYTTTTLQEIHHLYQKKMYRNVGRYNFKDMGSQEVFRAKIETVAPNGKLTLLTEQGVRKSYYFKEVAFLD